MACFYLVLTGCNKHLALNTYNFEQHYDAGSPIACEHLVRRSHDTVLVTVKITALKLPPDANSALLKSRYGFTWTLSPNYRSKEIYETDTVIPRNVYAPGNGSFTFNFALRHPGEDYTVLGFIITEKGTDRTYLFDIPLEFSTPDMQQRYALFSGNRPFPVTHPFVRIGDTVVIKEFHPGARKLWLKYYGLPFSPALPAMFTNPASSKSLKVLSSYEVTTDSAMIFNEAGLYFAQEDSGSRNGFMFMVMPNKFPHVTRATELISPLVYITTRDERNKLTASSKPKESLDQFWIDIGGNRDNARRIIREFYENVEQANNLFTNYKEGWKTDRGMVYIIFGKPEKVIRSDEKEVWYYDKNANFADLFFTFQHKPTIFYSNNYELERYADYDRIWYGTVEQWRKGVLKK